MVNDPQVVRVHLRNFWWISIFALASFAFHFVGVYLKAVRDSGTWWCGGSNVLVAAACLMAMLAVDDIFRVLWPDE